MVVFGGEVDRCKLAVLECFCPLTIAAQQFGQAERLALGLKHPVVGDGAELTDSAVDRADHDRRVFVNRSQARFQRPGKKRVEAGVGLRFWLNCFIHIDAVTAYEPSQHPVFHAGSAVHVRKLAGKT